MRKPSPESVLILLAIAVYSISRLFPHQFLWALILSALLLAVSAACRLPGAVHAALFNLLLTALPLTLPLFNWWPGYLLGPIAAYYVIVLPLTPLRETRERLRFGHINRQTFGLMALTVLVSSLALVIWARLAEPDLTSSLGQLRTIPPWMVPMAGVGFALVNAAIEEVAFRGIFLGAASRALRNDTAAIVLQAVPFGLIHYANGFPNGNSGTLLASVYGILLGIIRNRSRGMMAPVVTHFFADLTIFMILTTVM
jgi:membrane protease YdiL (CAAX protease family)